MVLTADILVNESLIVIRKLLSVADNSSSEANLLLSKFFLKSWGGIKSPMAKCSLLWLIGQNIEQVAMYAPDNLRIALLDFCTEDAMVKLFILDFSLLLLIFHLGSNDQLVDFSTNCFKYVTKLANVDQDVHVRDRARLLAGLFKRFFHDQDPIWRTVMADIFKFDLGSRAPSKSNGLGAALGESQQLLGPIPHISAKSPVDNFELPEWSAVVMNHEERHAQKDEPEIEQVQSLESLGNEAETNAVAISLTKPSVMSLDEFYAENETDDC